MPGLTETTLALAADETLKSGHTEIGVAHLLIALARLTERDLPPEAAETVTALKREFQQLGLDPKVFRRRLRAMIGKPGNTASPGTLRPSPACNAVFALAGLTADAGATSPAPVYLLRAAWAALAAELAALGAASAPRPGDGAKRGLENEPRSGLDGGARKGVGNDAKDAVNEASRRSLGELTQRMRALRQELLARIFGQDQAVEQFVEGLFEVEVTAAADSARRKPAGLFVFAGPPGAGKTYLAELGAQALERPFKRFDMASFAHSQEAGELAGSAPVYKGAKPGTLTGFVENHPNAVLLFDEIEKAHYTTIQLFLQILDAGVLQDKYTEQDVEFRDTIVIFTSNVGRRLYDNENSSGVHQANAAFHRRTILDALQTELDPHTGAPFFPAAICSRMATGHPILFNRLRVDDLARVAQAELARVAGLLERQHGQRYAFADEIPLALVMREGAQTDGRTIKAQAEAFLKNELFKACQLFADERVDAAFQAMESIAVAMDDEHAGALAARLFREEARPSILFAGDRELGEFLGRNLGEVDWALVSTPEQALDALARKAVDFVLLDLSLAGPPPAAPDSPDHGLHDISLLAPEPHPAPPAGTELYFDHAPPGARRFRFGQQLLARLHARAPDVPVYLYAPRGGALALGGNMDPELLAACVRAGGARGVIGLGTEVQVIDLETQAAAMRAEIMRVTLKLRREKWAAELAGRNQVLAFDTAPALREHQRLEIRCRNFRLAHAVRSADTGAAISDAERPVTRFEDVIGARGAKDALRFIRDWLKDPKKYAAVGVDSPRGVLFTGSPGTGKTLLARALAGESECAFFSKAATAFVTPYQGSGPEAIRDLFARARRYAPCVVFIDEIDAIGGNRAEVNAGHAGHGEALALNQLLVEMDGFAHASARPVIVIAATNRVETLDPALLRRFGRTIDVELPTRAEREQYLRRRLAAKGRHEVTDAMVVRLAAQGQGMSVADYERVLAQAAVKALENQGVLDDSILAEAFETVMMGEARAGTDGLRTARHEAGHALIMCATGAAPIYVTIVGRGNFGGYAALEDREERGSRTRPQLEDHICQLLGGREAEQLYYGADEGASTGPSNDLARASALAEAMVYDYGMSPDIGFVKIDRRSAHFGDIANRGHAAVCEIIQAQSARAQALLALHRTSLDRIVDALMEKGRLLQHELLELLDPSVQSRGNPQAPIL